MTDASATTAVTSAGGQAGRAHAAWWLPAVVGGVVLALLAQRPAGAAELVAPASIDKTLTANDAETLVIAVPAEAAGLLSLHQREGLIDVQVDLTAGQVLSLRSEAGRGAAIEVVLDGASATRWTVTVRPRKAGASFSATLMPFHAAREADHQRLAALRLYADAEQLRRDNFRETTTTARDPAVEARTRSAYAQALAGYEQAGDACGVLRSRIGRSRLEVSLGHYAAARADAGAALAAGCEAAVAERAQALKTLGMAAAYQGEFAESVRNASAALQLYQQTGDRRYQGIVLGNLSAVYLQQGATDHALDAAQRALAAAQETGDGSGVVFARKTIAAIHLARGDLALALEGYRATLNEIRNTAYPMIEGETWNDLGLLYHHMADFDGSLRAYRQAQRVWARMKYRTGLIDTTLNQGDALLEAGDRVAALSAFRRALAMAHSDGLQSLQARAWYALGTAYARTEDRLRARDALQRSLVLAQATGEPVMQSQVLRAQGDLARAMRHDDQALDAYERALELARSAADREAQAATLRRRALLRADQGALAAARIDAQQAREMVESLRGQINDPSLRTGYAESIRSYFDTEIDILMRLDAAFPGQGHAARALALADGARALSLQDLFAERAIELRRSVDPQLIRAERAAAEALNVAVLVLARLPDNAPRSQRLAAQDAFDDARHVLDQARGELRRGAPRYSELVNPTPISVDQVAADVLDDQTVLLEYWLGEQQSHAWLVTRDGLHSARLPARATIERWAADWRRELRQPPVQATGAGFDALASAPEADGLSPGSPASRLGQALLGVLPGRLTAHRIAVVADGTLQLVPFALLRPHPGAAPLGTRAELAYLPSLGTLRWLRRAPSRDARHAVAMIVADPALRPNGDMPRQSDAAGAGSVAARPLAPLPWAREEARAIAALLPPAQVVRLEGTRASRTALLSADWSQTSLLHLATHAIVDLRHPQLSGIVLAQYDAHGVAVDGFLRLDDIYDLDAPMDLVVLSGCETGVGRGAQAEGIYSLSRAFFFAGASRVVASLWSVDDRATAAFMTAFYRALLKDGASPAAALRTAQRQIAATPRWASEYYWAGFVLQGDWR